MPSDETRPFDAVEHLILNSENSHAGIFTSQDLAQLRKTFQSLRTECRVDAGSDAYNALGRAIIRLYRNGQTDPALVRSILLPAFERRGRG